MSHPGGAAQGRGAEGGPCIGGAFVLIPWLWIMGYRPDHNYELEPLSPRRSRGSREDTTASRETPPGVL